MPTSFQFYGPEPRLSEMLESSGGHWRWPGDRVSASTVSMEFSRFNGPVEYAELETTWDGLDTGYICFMVFDYVSNSVPINAIGLAQFTRPNGTTGTTRVDLTTAINGLIAQGAQKYLGYQVYGGLKLASMRLVLWE